MTWNGSKRALLQRWIRPLLPAPLRPEPAELLVIGAGLAGTEAAWQIAKAGLRVRLVEMRPTRRSPAHHSAEFAELVCSNSFGALSSDRAAGLLQEELRRLGSLVIGTADEHAVPAGGALAVDRGRYSAALTAALENHPLVTVVRQEQLGLPRSDQITVLATGPLTADALAKTLGVDRAQKAPI